MAYYTEAEDLINIGAYAKGSNPQIDEAISYIEPVRAFLRQAIGDKIDLKQCVDMMKAIFTQQNQQAAGGKARR
jgi:flagellum-specific ATP synthase